MTVPAAQPRYLCIDCGNALEPIPGRLMLWCRRCSKRRRVPTHPALIVRVSAQIDREAQPIS